MVCAEGSGYRASLCLCFQMPPDALTDEQTSVELALVREHGFLSAAEAMVWLEQTAYPRMLHMVQSYLASTVLDQENPQSGL